MKFNLEHILAACGLVKTVKRDRAVLDCYKAYEPPDGVKIKYEANAKGPFIIHVEIDREAITGEPIQPKRSRPVLLQLKKLELHVTKSEIPCMKRTFLHMTGLEKGQPFTDHLRLDRDDLLVYTFNFFRLMGYEAPETPKGIIKLIKKINKSKPGRFYFSGEIRRISRFTNLRLDCRVSKPKERK